MTHELLKDVSSAHAKSHPLQIPGFRRLWLNMVLSLLGDSFYLLAVQSLVFRLTGSAGSMATVLLFAAFPRVVLTLFGGALTDWISPRTILLVAITTRASLLACAGLLVIASYVELWHLYGIALIFGICDALALPAGSRGLPSLVPVDALLRATGFMQATVGIVTLAALAPIGAAIAAFGSGTALLIGAICLVFAAGVIPEMGSSGIEPHGAAQPLISAVREGIDYLFKTMGMLAVLATGMIFNLFIEGPIAVGLPYLGAERFESPTALGLLLSSVAAGDILGAIAASWFSQWPLHRLITAALLLCGAALALVGILTSLPLCCIALICASAAAETVNLHILTQVQKRVDPAFRGRVMSLVIVGSTGINPLSIALAGGLIASLQDASFVAAGIGVALVGCCAAVSLRTRALRDQR